MKKDKQLEEYFSDLWDSLINEHINAAEIMDVIELIEEHECDIHFKILCVEENLAVLSSDYLKCKTLAEVKYRYKFVNDHLPIAENALKTKRNLSETKHHYEIKNGKIAFAELYKLHLNLLKQTGVLGKNAGQLKVGLYHEKHSFTQINDILDACETTEHKLAYLLDYKTRIEQSLIDNHKVNREKWEEAAKIVEKEIEKIERWLKATAGLNRNEVESIQSTIENKKDQVLEITDNTPEKKENKVLELIYEHLNGVCFNASYEQFERFFVDNGTEFKKIVWLKDLAEIKALFDWLLFNNIFSIAGIPKITYINKWIGDRFYFEKEGSPVNTDSLGASTTKTIYSIIKRGECNNSLHGCDHLFTELFNELLRIKNTNQYKP